MVWVIPLIALVVGGASVAVVMLDARQLVSNTNSGRVEGVTIQAPEVPVQTFVTVPEEVPPAAFTSVGAIVLQEGIGDAARLLRVSATGTAPLDVADATVDMASYPWWLEQDGARWFVRHGAESYSLGLPVSPRTGRLYERGTITAVSSDDQMLLLRIQRFDEADPVPDFRNERLPYEDTEFLFWPVDARLQPTQFVNDELLGSFGPTDRTRTDAPRVMHWDRSAYRFLLQQTTLDGACGSVGVLYVRTGELRTLAPRSDLGESFGCATASDDGSFLLLPRRTEGGSTSLDLLETAAFPVIRHSYDLTPLIGDAVTVSNPRILPWDAAQGTVVVSLPPRLVALDLDRGHRHVVYTDTTLGLGYQPWDAERLARTADGSHVVLVDYANIADDPLQSEANRFSVRVVDLTGSRTAVWYTSSATVSIAGWAPAGR